MGEEPDELSGMGFHRSHKLANWLQRFGATAIDVVLTYVAASVLIFILGIPGSIGIILWLGAWGWLEVHGVDGRGTSIGKKALNLTVVAPRINPQTRKAWACYPKPSTLTLRFLCHALDTLVFYLGWLRPMWNVHRQTWADSIAGTMVFWNWPHDDKPLVEQFTGPVDTW
jgi:uncharacterized RDD family membrane protein YckC